MPRSRFARIALAAVVLVLPAASPSVAAAGPGPGGAAAAEAGPDYGAFLAGTVAGQRGDDAAAAAFLRDAQRGDPADGPLRHTAFMFAALSGSPDAPALAGTVKPDLLSTLVLADAAGRAGDWRRAGELFSHLPADPLAALIEPPLLAWAQAGAGDPAAASRTLSGCRGPMVAPCLLDAGEIAELAGHPAEARIIYDRAENQFGLFSLAALQTAGSFLARGGRGREADAMLDTLVGRIPLLGMVRDRLRASLDRPAVANAAQGLARSYLGIAELLRDTGGGNGRIAAGFMLRFALDMQPDLAAARLTLAELQAPKHPAGALEILAGVAPADPLHPLAELRSATLLAASGRRDEALDRLRALSDSLPDRPEPAEALGDVLSDAGSWSAAVAAYDRAIDDERRLEGGTLAGEDWRVLFSRAVAEDRADRWPAARTDLRAALALSPSQPLVLNYLGYSMVERREDLPQARRLIQRALDAKPEDGSIRDSLGWAMLRGDDVSAAVTTLERAAEQDPEDPTVNFHLGAAYWAAGRRIEAEDQWRWALVLHPDADAARQIRDALARASAAPPPAAVATGAPDAPGASAARNGGS